jgi:hypothetical protein
MKQHASVQAAREIGTRTRDPSIRALIDYWLQIHPGDRLPGRRHLDPADIPELLPGIVLTDIERDPFRIRFRLVGTKVGEAFGEEFTGRYLDEAVPDWETSFIYLHRKVVAETGMPHYWYGPASVRFRLDYAPIERIYLPLAGDGETVDMILAMTVYRTARPGSATT